MPYLGAEQSSQLCHSIIRPLRSEGFDELGHIMVHLLTSNVAWHTLAGL